MYRRYLIFFLFLAVPALAGAYFYPPDALNFTGQFSGNTTNTIITGATPANPYTILAIRMQQEKDLSTTAIDCAGKQLAYNWAKDYTIDLLQTKCTGDIVLTKTGNDKVFVSITYIKHDASLHTDITEPYNLLASSSLEAPIPVYASMTAGDLIIVIMLFLLFMFDAVRFFMLKV